MYVLYQEEAVFELALAVTYVTPGNTVPASGLGFEKLLGLTQEQLWEHIQTVMPEVKAGMAASMVCPLQNSQWSFISIVRYDSRKLNPKVVCRGEAFLKGLVVDTGSLVWPHD